MLNIPADAGTERAGTSARRIADADAKGGGFRALFDEVAQAAAAERTARSAAAPEDAEAGGTAGTADPLPQSESEADRLPYQDKAIDAGQADPANDGAPPPADPDAAGSAATDGSARQDEPSAAASGKVDTPEEAGASGSDSAVASGPQSEREADRLPQQGKAADAGQADHADNGRATPAEPGMMDSATTDGAAPPGERSATAASGKADAPDDAETATVPQRASERGDTVARGSAQDPAPEEPGAGRTGAVPQSERGQQGKAVDTGQADHADDGKAVPAGQGTARSRTTDGAARPREDRPANARVGKAHDDKAPAVDSNAAAPGDATVDAPPREAGDAKSADRNTGAPAPETTGQDSKRTGHKADGGAKPALSSAASAPASAAAAPAPTAASAPTDHPNAGPTDRAPDGAGKPAQKTAGKDKGASTATGREAPSGGKGQAAHAQSDSSRVRFWAKGDSAAALAARTNGDRQRHGDAPADAPHAENRTAPVRSGDQPINVRVTAYERHLAPAGFSGNAKATIPTAATIATAPTPEPHAKEADRAEAGPVKMPHVSGRNQAWQSLAPQGRGGTSATATNPSGKLAATRQDPVATPDSMPSSGNDTKDARQGQTADSTLLATPGQDQQKQPAARSVSPSGSAPAAGAATSSAPAPAAPLVAGVASGIAGALGSARAAAAGQPAPARPAATAEAAAGAPVRTIALNLDMREYGQIDLRISLKGNVVSVQVKAERAETAQALARDDASLRDALHHAGYDAQQIQIDKRAGAQPRLADAAASGQQQAGGTGTGASSGSAGGNQHAATPQERPQPRPDANTFSVHDQDAQDVPRQDRYRGSDRLYV